MKHVIYRTEYYSHAGVLLREEESDAYFNTIENDPTIEFEAKPPIGCRLLQPKLVPSRISKEQWAVLSTKKPDYQLKYASLYDIDNEQYAIYAIYERYFEEESSEAYSLCVTIGSKREVSLYLTVIPVDYDLVDFHTTKWDAIEYDGITPIKTGDCVHIASNNKVTIFYKDFTIEGEWESMEQISKCEFVYHCHNSLFHFDITISIERGEWNGDYEELLHN